MVQKDKSKEELVEEIKLLQKRIAELEAVAGKQQLRILTAAEAALRESEEKYRIVADNAYDWEYWMAPDASFVYTSLSCKRVTGYDVEEFMHDKELLERIIVPEDRPVFLSHHQETLKYKLPSAAEFRITRLDGETRWIFHICQPVFDKAGNYLGIRGSNSDITERKRADSLKDEFVRIVSHELRTPLTTIREGVSQVLDGILGDTTAKQREFLSICLADIDRLERIINNLLDISKIEAGMIRLKKGSIDIISIAKGIVSSFEPKAKEKGLELKANYSGEKICAYVDADKITQAFTNLVGNALKFTDKGRIEVSVEEKEDKVECAVADTGIGISSGNLSKVFDKFQQFGRLSGAGETGTGLGLSITKGIVELHDGKIWVESEIDKGAKFCFTLPKYTREEILHESIENRIRIAKKEGKELSLLLFKFDNYKEIEGRYGKEKLQELFLIISGLLKEAVRSGEVVAEGGADEIILLEEVGKQNMPRMNARLKRAIKESIFEFDAKLRISLSQGHSTYPDDADNAEDLLKKARAAMVSESQGRLKKKIMIVDDESVVIDVLEKFLRKLGYNNFIKAYDGDEALAKIKNSIPDLVILDMKIPKMDGYMVVEKLKEGTDTKNIPILIMSGYKVETGRLKNHTMKENIPVIEKPVSIEQLDRMAYYLL